MIWLKRLALPVLVIIIWFTYSTYDKYRTKKFTATADRLALVTAQVWVGTAVMRDNPSGFLAWRDSVLTANSLSAKEMDDFLERLQGDGDNQQAFSKQTTLYVDSLIAILDSAREVEALRIRDSVSKAHDDSLLTAMQVKRRK